MKGEPTSWPSGARSLTTKTTIPSVSSSKNGGTNKMAVLTGESVFLGQDW